MGEEGSCSLSSALIQSLRLGSHVEANLSVDGAENEDERKTRRPLKPLPSSHHHGSGNTPAGTRVPSSTQSETDSDGDAASLRDEADEPPEPEWESKTTAPTSPTPSSPTSASLSRSRSPSKQICRPPSRTQKGHQLFQFAQSIGHYPNARRTSPTAVSQRDLRMLLPYWPRHEASQEVALLNASGEVGGSILCDMEEQARLFAQERSLARSPRPSLSSSAKSLHQSSRPGDGSRQSVDADDELVNFHSAVSPPANHKKRKSSRSALEDPHYFGGSGVPDVAASSGKSSSWHDGNLTEFMAASETVTADDGADKKDDDGVERPDSSAASFRAVRLVDELYAASASRDGDHEQEWPALGRRCDHHRHSLPWAHRRRRLLRSEVKLRLSIRRARNEFWSDLAVLEAEQEEEERLSREKAAAEAALARASAAEAEKKRRERTSKAEKRVQALKGGKSSSAGGNAKKLTLADLRARTAAASQGGGQGESQASAKSASTPGESPSRSSTTPAVSRRDGSTSIPAPTAAKAPTSQPGNSLPSSKAPSGPFMFRCDSSTARELATARLKLQAVLSKPFDEVVEDLDLPDLTQEARASWDKGVADRRCVMIKAKAPMVWPEEDRPRAKFAAGTISSAILRKMGLDVPEDHKRAKDFIFKLTPWNNLSTSIAGDDKINPAAQPNDVRARKIGSEPEGKGPDSKAKAKAALSSMAGDAIVAGTQPHRAQRGDISCCPQSMAAQPSPATSPTSPSEVPLPSQDQFPASSASSPSLSSSAQPPKTSPKMSRRKKANMNNIHHQLNSARWTTSSPSAATSANASTAYANPHQETTSSHNRPITSSALFPDEYICLFCEYALYYGTRPLLLKACRHRKNTVKRKTQAEDNKKRREGKAAGPMPSSNSAGHHHDHTCTECGCDISHQVTSSSGSGSGSGNGREVGSHHPPRQIAAPQEGTAGPSVSTANARPGTLPALASHTELPLAPGRS